MSFADDKDDRRRKATQSGGSDSSQTSRAKRKKRGDSPEVGQALRSVYDETVNEEIPPEMLDLLGRLG